MSSPEIASKPWVYIHIDEGAKKQSQECCKFDTQMNCSRLFLNSYACPCFPPRDGTSNKVIIQRNIRFCWIDQNNWKFSGNQIWVTWAVISLDPLLHFHYAAWHLFLIFDTVSTKILHRKALTLSIVSRKRSRRRFMMKRK